MKLLLYNILGYCTQFLQDSVKKSSAQSSEMHTLMPNPMENIRCYMFTIKKYFLKAGQRSRIGATGSRIIWNQAG